MHPGSIDPGPIVAGFVILTMGIIIAALAYYVIRLRKNKGIDTGITL